jgi:hypothetical protein
MGHNKFIDFIKKFNELGEGIKLFIVFIIAILTTLGIMDAPKTNTDLNTEELITKVVSRLNALRDTYHCDYVAVYIISDNDVNNGAYIYRPFQSSVPNILDKGIDVFEDFPLENVENAFIQMVTKGYIYISTTNDVNEYPYVVHAMNKFDLKTMFCVPIYKKIKTNKWYKKNEYTLKPFGIVTYEYKSDMIVRSDIISNMIKDAKMVEMIISNHKK